MCPSRADTPCTFAPVSSAVLGYQRVVCGQVFFGCAIAFASFGAQVYFRPFREPEANVLKALVDAQIFLTFLISFILRTLGALTVQGVEPLTADFYGWLLLGSMALLLATGAALTGRQILRRRKFRTGLIEMAADTGGFGMVGLSAGLGGGGNIGAGGLSSGGEGGLNRVDGDSSF